MQYIVHLFSKFSSLLNLNTVTFALALLLVFGIFLPMSITSYENVTAAAQYRDVGQIYDDPNLEETSTYANILDPDADEGSEDGSSVSNKEEYKSDVLSGIGASTATTTTSDGGIGGFIDKSVSILSFIVGVVAIIFIIFSGFKYITATGDTAKISTAKSTLIYSLIGLIVAALAKFLVDLVFTSASG